MSLTLAIFLGITVIASVSDIRARRIPNWLTSSSIVISIALGFALGPMHMLVTVAAVACTILVGSVAFGAGWFGGGDIKLLAAGAAAVGYPHFFTVLLYIAVAGGGLAVIVSLRQHNLRAIFGNMARSFMLQTPIVPLFANRRLPYALAICAGSFTYAASESIAPWFWLAR